MERSEKEEEDPEKEIDFPKFYNEGVMDVSLPPAPAIDMSRSGNATLLSESNVGNSELEESKLDELAKYLNFE